MIQFVSRNNSYWSNKLQKYGFFSLYGAFCGIFSAKSPQRDFLEDFIERSCGLQETLEIHQFLHVGMEIGLLLNGITNLEEKLLVDQLFDAANREMRHKILPVAEIAQVVESIEKVCFKVKQGLGLFVHAKPEHAWHVVAAKESCAVEIERERLVLFGHLLASLDDGRDVVFWCLAQKLQRQMYLVGFHIVDIMLMLKVFLQLFHHGGKLRATWDGNGQKSAFGFHGLCVSVCKNRLYAPIFGL